MFENEEQYLVGKLTLIKMNRVLESKLKNQEKIHSEQFNKNIEKIHSEQFNKNIEKLQEDIKVLQEKITIYESK